MSKGKNNYVYVQNYAKIREFFKRLFSRRRASYRQSPVVLNSSVTELAKFTAEKYSVPIETGIYTTVLHELGHAIQEANGLESNEEQAEEFAYFFYYYGDIIDFKIQK